MHVRLPSAHLSPHAILSTDLFLSLLSFTPAGIPFRSLSSRSSISPGSYPARSMLFYPTDNSIILHAKTASDVLAQSASHLCEQITSYRKTDFIFKEERGGSDFFFLFFFFIHPRYSTLLLFSFHLSSLSLLLLFSLSVLSLFFCILVLLYAVYSGGQDWHD